MSAKNRQSVTYRELASVATNGVSRNSSCCVETFELLSIRYQQSLDLLKSNYYNSVKIFFLFFNFIRRNEKRK